MIGLVNVEGVGAKQLQGIRDSLRGSAVMKMSRNTLMIRALEKKAQKMYEKAYMIRSKTPEKSIKLCKEVMSFVPKDSHPYARCKKLLKVIVPK